MFCGLFLQTFSQELAEDYHLYKLEREPQEEFSLTTDTLLFFRALHFRSDLFGELSDYRFSFVEYNRRGFDFFERDANLDGITLRRSNISIVRRLGLTERGYSGLAHDSEVVAGVVGLDYFSSVEQMPLSGGNVGLFFSGRGYLGGARASLHSLSRRGWSSSLTLAARCGDDLYVRGVGQDALDVGFRIRKDFSSGAIFSLTALCSLGQRGMRTGSTEEAFMLTGDKLYNPLWGMQSGKERNSRTRRDAVPFMVATLDMAVGQNTRMKISVGGDCGLRSYSSLGWYDAMSPRPDNYRYLPSYFADEDVAAAVAEQWRDGNLDYVQVNWADLYAQNRMSDDGAVYALERRVERIARGEIAARFVTQAGQNLTLHYGVSGELDSSREYKQMEDLLGAEYLRDIDYYLIDDDTFSNNLQNNLLNPSRKVMQGDRFAYDYSLVERSLSVNAGLRWQADRLRVGVDAQIGASQIFRRGYYEKELFAGEKSYGRSQVAKFSPYALKALVGYSFSAKHYLDIGFALHNAAPEREDVFLNPYYNNRQVDNPCCERNLLAEINYKFHSQRADVVLSAYLAQRTAERDVYRQYDDLSGEYCGVDIQGIGTLRYGVEVAAKLRLSQQLYLDMMAAAGRYIYSHNPEVSHYRDTDNMLLSAASKSYMGECYVGGAPQLSAAATLTYFNRQWVLSAGVNYAGERYVEPSFVRRTERVARQGAASDEIFQALITQRRLEDAFSVDASVSRWFWVGKSRLSLTLSVRNLLGVRNTIYGGYESSRIRHYRSGEQMVYAPQDDIITYSYPRTFYAVVSWKF